MTAAALAKRLHRIDDERGPEAAESFLREVDAAYGRETVIEVLRLYRDRAAFEYDEVEAEHMRRNRQGAEMRHILDGLGEIAFGDAVAIKAAQGDPVALKWERHLNSRQHKLDTALLAAAVELHPAWRRNDDGTIEKIDDAAPEEAALVEWLYKDHPDRAREVEATVAN